MDGHSTARTHPGWHLLVLVCASLVAYLGCRDHVGGWNDASRLATVESLVDRHTLVIDDSLFVRGPGGTMDKLLIQGHYYSDKSPVPAILMAGPYWVWKQLTGQTATSDTPGFCQGMSLTSSGLAYVVAVWSVFGLGGLLGLALRPRLFLTASLALATVAPVYAQQVNSHIFFLGAAGPLMLCVVLAVQTRRLRWFLLLGLLAGLAYSADLGAGPPLLLCLAGWLAWRFRSPRILAVFALGVLPFFLLHHALNHSIAGTWKPANSVPEYLDYPDSPFSTSNMTGTWQHSSPGKLVVYLLALLFGKKGFFGHNLPLFLCLPGLVWLIRRRVAEVPEVLFAVGWFLGTWLLYGVASNNYSGMCYSVRWFVPLLIPAYFVLALVLREWPEQLDVFLLLSAGGMVLAGWMVWKGPWTGRMIPHFWPTQAIVLLVWGWLRARAVPSTKPDGTRTAYTACGHGLTRMKTEEIKG